MTLDEKIDELRSKLNDLILNNANYDEIYKASIMLDELIVEYYKINKITA